MKKRIATGVSACMLLAGMLQAEIVVSAGRVPTAAEDVSSSVSTVTAAELERWQVQTLPEALQMLPGVHLTRNGGLGQRAAIFVRGTDGDRVLVLVDGIEINDPSSTGRRADLTMLNATDIERVEVLRGSQSALYGADAMGGVINIVTKRGEGPTSFSLLGEAGSFKTWRGAASLSGATGIVDYAVSVTRVESEGISAANEADGNTEKDGYDWTAVSARVGIAPLENLSVDLVARYTDTSADYDAGAGEGGDAEGNVADTESILLGGTIKLGLLDSTWQQAVSASVASHDREFVSGWGNNWFDSEVAKAGWQHDVYLNDANVLTAGIEVEAEKAETDGLPEVDSAVRSLYVQDQVRLDAVTLVGGLRLDDHDTFGDEVTGRVGAALKCKQTGGRLKATYGTGFKAPSLYQLYAPASTFGAIGNPDLEPETSQTWDAGVEVPLGAGTTVEVTYFESDYDNLIAFENGYVNESEATIKGVELAATVALCEQTTLGLTYTYTDTEDEDGASLIRRPRNRATADLQWHGHEDVTVNLACVYVGSRRDSFFSSTMFESVEEEMPGSVVVNLAASWDVCDTVTVFGRVENLFDKDYEMVAGYGTPGIAGYGGLRVTL